LGIIKWRSLRARTGASFTLLVALLLLGLSGVLVERASLLEESRAQAALQAARMRLEVAWSAPVPENAERRATLGLRLLHTARSSAEAREAAEDAQSLALLLVGADGRELYRSPGHAPQWPLTGSPDWETVQVPRDGTLAVLALPRFRARLALQRQRESLLLLSGVALACAALGSWVLVGRTLSPIGKLSRQARAAARSGASGLQTRLVAPSPDREMTELVETFNALLQRLSEDAGARGRFYAAASHELRTPLQALGGHLDLALSRDRDAASYRAALEEARGQSRRLAGLVSELLRLNQLEMSTSKPASEPLELPDLLESVLASLQPTLHSRGLRLETNWQDETAGEYEILAPRAHAEMLVRNLLDNAVKYSEDGGLVSVQLEQDAAVSSLSSVRLEVWNACAPREDWQVEKWCEPFFRPDTSRRSQTGGSGLGLALVKALCDANGWELSVRAEASGVRASVLFAREDSSSDTPST
jgi:two-component system heavy metal sensor histidine kinase CusS